MRKPMWNDGPSFEHFLTDPDRPVSPNICFGGGTGAAPSPPDYSQYISDMTQTGHTLQGYGANLYDWAQKSGLDLQSIAKTLSGQASTAATGEQGRADQLMDTWQQQTSPLYQAQVADATRMISDLPSTEEEYAGKFGADAGQAIDQQLAAEQRTQQGLGISPGVASTALDTQARIGRAAATTAAAEQGRMQARTEARNVTGNALTSEQFVPGVAGQSAGLATANRTQAEALPAGAITTTAGAYAPSMGYYNSAEPYVQQWGNTMGNAYNQELAQYKASAENQDEGGFMSTILPLAGGMAGSFFGPMGSAVGSSVGKAAGSWLTSKSGGKIPKNGGRRVPRYASGGAIDTAPPDQSHYVDPSMSPSGGAETDDVHAMVNAGEFVIPERTVDWYGEKFFQNLISKADNEAQQQTVAQPEEHQADGPSAAAISTMPPQFRSEGARA